MPKTAKKKISHIARAAAGQCYYASKKRKEERIAKKKLAPSIKNHFQTATNFQGFPKHLCTYIADIERHVYIPENYGKRAPWRDQSFCKSCLLKPCITLEHLECIGRKSVDEYSKEEKKTKCNSVSAKRELAVKERLQKFTVGLMRKYLGSAYMNERKETPDCVLKATHEHSYRFYLGQDE